MKKIQNAKFASEHKIKVGQKFPSHSKNEKSITIKEILSVKNILLYDGFYGYNDGYEYDTIVEINFYKKKK